MKRWIATGFFILIPCIAAFAQTAPSVELSTAQLEAAGLLVDVLKTNTDLIAMALPLEMKRFRTEHPNATDAVAADYEAAFRQAFDVKNLRDFYSRVYAKHFSESELRQLADIFRSDLMQKYNHALPEINEDTHILMEGAALKIQIARNQAITALKAKGELP